MLKPAFAKKRLIRVVGLQRFVSGRAALKAEVISVCQTRFKVHKINVL